MSIFTDGLTGIVDVGFFTHPCEMPILQYNKTCADPFVMNMPTMITQQRIKPGTTQPLLTNAIPTLNIPVDLGECDFATGRTDLTTCTMLVPPMVQPRFADQLRSWESLVDDFCNAKNLVNHISPFLPNGQFDPGQPISGPFARFVFAHVALLMKTHLEENAVIGEATNSPISFDGWYTQLVNGWQPASGYSSGCDDYNTAICIDWNIVTGASGLASPADVMVEDELVVWGNTLTGFAGKNMAQVMYELSKIIRHANRNHGMVDFEIVTPDGQSSCIEKVAACVQPECNCDTCQTDMGLRDRYANMVNTQIVRLYPDNTPIPVVQARGLEESIVLSARRIGGRPTYGWVFRDMNNAMATLSRFFGQDTNMPMQPMSDPLMPHNMDMSRLMREFGTIAFHKGMNSDPDRQCLQPTLKTSMTLMVFARESNVVFKGVACDPSLPCEVTDPNVGPRVREIVGCADAPPAVGFDSTVVITLDSNLEDVDLAAPVRLSNGSQVYMGEITDISGEPTVYSVSFTGATVDCSANFTTMIY